MAKGFDVIGDIHGHSAALESLLIELGYRETGGAFGHPQRQVVFVGDLIDRGPGQLRTLQIARRMVEAGNAQMVLGNHEFNAIGWVTPNGSGGFMRKHSKKNRKQHSAFLSAVGEDSKTHRDWIGWFRTLPMWLDLGGLRVVHACWHEPSRKLLGSGLAEDEIVSAAKGTDLHDALEIVLKGPELYMGGMSYTDWGGNCRDHARFRWWDPAADTLAAGCEIPPNSLDCSGEPFAPLPQTPLDSGRLPTAPTEVPVLYGHYWRSGATPQIDGPLSACLDWSVAGGGPLVAYRWSGEAELNRENLVAVRSQRESGASESPEPLMVWSQ